MPFSPNTTLEGMGDLLGAAGFKQAFELGTCKRCGSKVTVTDETDPDRVAEYIRLFSALDPRYKNLVAALSLIDFFTTYEEKMGSEFAAEVQAEETIEGKADIAEAKFKESQRRAAARYDAYERLGGVAVATKPQGELSILDYGSELLRRAACGDGAVLMKIIVTPPRPIILQLLRHAVFMQMTPNLCEGCSRCCEDIKSIELEGGDVERITAHLKISRGEFKARYVRKITDEHGKRVRTFKRTAPCMWLKDGRCMIYPARPNVCVFYPFLTDVQRPGRSTAIMVPGFCKSALDVVELLQGKEARIQLERATGNDPA